MIDFVEAENVLLIEGKTEAGATDNQDRTKDVATEKGDGSELSLNQIKSNQIRSSKQLFICDSISYPVSGWVSESFRFWRWL